MRARLGTSAISPGLNLAILGAAVILSRALLWTQTEADKKSTSPALVTFTIDFPKSEPPHYSISVDSAGHGTYECTAKTDSSDDRPDDAEVYRTEFEVSQRNREKIFDWAKQAKYFSGKIESETHNLAFTGDKVLSYEDGARSFTARYNYSSQEPVRQLTMLFQNMADTLDYGRRLTFDHRYQKLALDAELARMEEQAKNNQLSEIQSVAPVLRKIAEDTTVMNVVRARARTLMQMADSAAH